MHTRARTHTLTNSPCTSRGTTQNPFPAGSFPALCCQWLLRQRCNHTCMHREDHTYCMHAHTYTHTHSTHVHASNHYNTSHRVTVCSRSSRLTFHCKCPPLQWKASSSQSPVNLGRNNEDGAESRDPKISNETQDIFNDCVVVVWRRTLHQAVRAHGTVNSHGRTSSQIAPETASSSILPHLKLNPNQSSRVEACINTGQQNSTH